MHLLRSLAAIISLMSMSTLAAPTSAAKTSEYVVRMTPNMPSAQVDHVMGAVRTAIGNLGQVKREYNFHDFQGFSFEAPEAVMQAIQAIPGIATVHANEDHHTLDQVNTRTEQDPTGYALDRISHINNANTDNRKPPQFIYTLPDGQYTTIYYLDSGIRISHEDFGGRAIKGANFAPNNVLPGHAARAFEDYTDHGTPGAGLAAGTQYGVAKYANIVDVRIFNDNGSTTYADEIAGIDYAVNAAQRNNLIGASVINFSAGGIDNGQANVLNQAVQSAINAGMFFSVSAGNSRVDVATTAPANVADACTVGGTDASDVEYYQSNYGQGVDIFAPAYQIRAPSSAGDASTKLVTGTSFSAPLVAGVASVLKSYPNSNNQALNPVQLCALLVSTSNRGKIKLQNYPDDTGGPNNLLYLQN